MNEVSSYPVGRHSLYRALQRYRPICRGIGELSGNSKAPLTRLHYASLVSGDPKDPFLGFLNKATKRATYARDSLAYVSSVSKAYILLNQVIEDAECLAMRVLQLGINLREVLNYGEEKYRYGPLKKL